MGIPAFFDIMTHLTLHVVEELDVMAEGYFYDETIGFVTKYMQDFLNVRHQIWDGNKEEGVCSEVLEGARIKFILDSECRDLAHQYVLMNASCMAPWVW